MRTVLPFILICLFHLASLPGCCTPSRADRSNAVEPGPRVVEGDFDDINAVVAGVLPHFFIIDLPKGSDDPSERRFDLRTLDDRPGSLVFRHLPDNRLEMNCAIGRFGDQALESRIMDAMAERFKQILGDVAAPMSKLP